MAAVAVAMTFGNGMESQPFALACYNWVSNVCGDVAGLYLPALTVEYRYQRVGVAPGHAYAAYQLGNSNPGLGAPASWSWALEVVPNTPDGTHQKLRFTINSTSCGLVTVFDVTTLQDASEHHVAVSYDPAGSAKLYHGGTLLSTVGAPCADLAAGADTLMLTGTTSDAISYRMDNFRFVNQIDLGAAIATRAASGF
jgi:hypothetical protein